MRSITKIRFKFLLAISLVLFIHTSAKAQSKWLIDLKNENWLSPINELILLRSVRSDVEKSLGKPENLTGNSIVEYYTVANGRFAVSYSGEDCWANESKIAKNVVEEINFSPSTTVKFDSINLPMSKFIRSKEGDTPIEIYTNEEEGIEIEVQNEEITGITLVPESKLNYRCKTKKCS